MPFNGGAKVTWISWRCLRSFGDADTSSFTFIADLILSRSMRDLAGEINYPQYQYADAKSLGDAQHLGKYRQ